MLILLAPNIRLAYQKHQQHDGLIRVCIMQPPTLVTALFVCRADTIQSRLSQRNEQHELRQGRRPGPQAAQSHIGAGSSAWLRRQLRSQIGDCFRVKVRARTDDNTQQRTYLCHSLADGQRGALQVSGPPSSLLIHRSPATRAEYKLAHGLLFGTGRPEQSADHITMTRLCCFCSGMRRIRCCPSRTGTL